MRGEVDERGVGLGREARREGQGRGGRGREARREGQGRGGRGWEEKQRERGKVEREWLGEAKGGQGTCRGGSG